MSDTEHIPFHQLSYEKHEQHLKDHLNDPKRASKAKSWLEKDTVDAWRHRRMYESIDPLLEYDKDASWLTIGDGRYGLDASYIKQKGGHVLATDISDSLLKKAKDAGHIDHCQKANAEKLPFDDNDYDFVLCKESYHHFPRPMIALYEMLRVSRKAVVLIEPSDEYAVETIRETSFMCIKNLVKLLLGKQVAKHHFETVGNYIYGISKRELEKAALGLNLKTLAFKGMNDCYVEGVEKETAHSDSNLFRRIKREIAFHDLLAKLGLKRSGLLVAIIFKETPSSELTKSLEAKKYEVVNLPPNPYV